MDNNGAYSDDKSHTVREHSYITSAKGLGGWVRKMAIFANLHYYIYAGIVVGYKKSKILLT